MSKRKARLAAVTAILLFLAPAQLPAETLLLEVEMSSDVTTDLSGTTVNDEDVAVEPPDGPVLQVTYPGVPASTDVIAHHVLPGGDELLAFDTTIELPGAAAPITVRRGDVARFDGFVYALGFDAGAAGVPAGVMTDAVTAVGEDLLLSFDTTVALDVGVAEDEDLVRWTGTELVLFLDASAEGIPAELDLDGAHLVEANGHLLLSFDGSGTLEPGTENEIDFDDEDVLELTSGSPPWELAYDGSTEHAGWRPADADSVNVLSDADCDTVADPVDNCPAEPNPAQDPTACLCGDVNGDGGQNFIDGRLILLGQVPPEGARKCDVNGDGGCNFIDGRLVLLGQIPPDQCPAATIPPSCP